MSKIFKIVIVILIFLLIGLTVWISVVNAPVSEEKILPSATENPFIVPTMSDIIENNAIWCCTFQLVWNDMKNDVVKKDIIFTPQEIMADNLNKEEFMQNMISDKYYYKKYGLKSLELKAQIEKGIKDKFNQKSDILEDFDWTPEGLNDSNNPNMQRYFFYTMLYRTFEFEKEFTVLDKSTFANGIYNDVEYFGIDYGTDDSLNAQINILYYNSKEDFAVVLKTKDNDEVILCKNPEGKTFNEIYTNMNNKADIYVGDKIFKDTDVFKAPKLVFNEKREYTELQNKMFLTANPQYPEAIIIKSIQSISFELDEKGGKIKSEAAIDMPQSAASEPIEEIEYRYFNADDKFAIFLKEEGKSLPYFAAKIADITKFQ